MAGTLNPAHALAGLAFPSVQDLLTGARVDVAPTPATPGGGSLRVECGDVELFGIAGLRSSGVRAAACLRHALLSASLATISSPIGSQTRVVAEAGCSLPRTWQGAVRVGLERVELDRDRPGQWLVAGAISRIDVGRVAAVANVDVVRGERVYDTSLSMAAVITAGAAQLTGSVRIDGNRFVGAGIGIAARLHTNLRVLAGYDDGAQSVRAGAVITWRRLEVATGVFQHPVLGISQGVTVACTR